MEVLSIITSSLDFLEILNDFFEDYPKLKELRRDDDTIYYSKSDNDKIEIYYHFMLSDVSKEFSYNYTEEDKLKIANYFDRENIFIIDISFRTISFKNTLLHDLCLFMKEREKIELFNSILVSDPYDGICELRMWINN